jgi:hypothetical protein
LALIGYPSRTQQPVPIRPRLDILDLNGLGRVIEDRIGHARPDRRRGGWFNQQFQQCGRRRRSSLLESRDGLAERFAARCPVRGLELGILHPTEQGSGPDPRRASRLVHVALGEQRGDGFLLFASELSRSSCH